MIAGTRNADLGTLRDLLVDQHARKIDIVAPASKIRSEEGVIVVKGADAVIDENGVTQTDGRYLPTVVFDEGIAEKLKIPLAYVRRLRFERPDLYDANVNGWLQGRRPKGFRDGQGVWHEQRPAIEGDGRSFLIRAFRGDDGKEGAARAFLSDRFKTTDNLDVLTAALDGVAQAGHPVEITGCDLTDRRMYVRVQSEAVKALAPTLLDGYRSPYSGLSGADNPTVFAGFEISNSEVGGGAFTITPRLVVEVCSNGMKITKDAFREVHLGGRLDEGVIRWSEDTQRKSLEVVTARARDSVATFLDVEYMERVIRDLEAKSGVRLSNAAEGVKTVSKRLAFSEETTNGVLDMFIRGGQTTAGGVMQAVTAYAQSVDDADLAASLEADALKALDFAAALV